MNSEFKKSLPKFQGCDVFLFTYFNNQLQQFLKTHKTELTFIRNSITKQSPELHDFEPKGSQNFILFLIKNTNLIGMISAYRSTTKGNWIHFVWCSHIARNQGFGSYMTEKIEQIITNECETEYTNLKQIKKVRFESPTNNSNKSLKNNNSNLMKIFPAKCEINVIVIPSSCRFYEKNDYTFKRMLPLNEYNVVNSIYFKELPF